MKGVGFLLTVMILALMTAGCVKNTKSKNQSEKKLTIIPAEGPAVPVHIDPPVANGTGFRPLLYWRSELNAMALPSNDDNVEKLERSDLEGTVQGTYLSLEMPVKRADGSLFFSSAVEAGVITDHNSPKTTQAQIRGRAGVRYTLPHTSIKVSGSVDGGVTLGEYGGHGGSIGGSIDLPYTYVSVVKTKSITDLTEYRQSPHVRLAVKLSEIIGKAADLDYDTRLPMINLGVDFLVKETFIKKDEYWVDTVPYRATGFVAIGWRMLGGYAYGEAAYGRRRFDIHLLPSGDLIARDAIPHVQLSVGFIRFVRGFNFGGGAQ